MNAKMKLETQKDWYEFSKLVAAEGIVLLKNENNVLPLKNEKIALFGTPQIRAQKATDGVAVSDESVGIATAFTREGITIDKELYECYDNWYQKTIQTNVFGGNYSDHNIPELEISREFAEEIKSRGAEKAFILLARYSYENSDMFIEKGDYLLTDIEYNMIKNICSVFDKVVLMLHIGCSIDFGFLDDCKIDGILYLNQLGVNGAVSVAKIVKGEVNPSGRLTVSLSKHFEDYPSSGYFGQHGGGLLQDYREDIYVGYRYFDTFKGKDKNLLFPFGYGLSYTNFEMSDVTFEKSEKQIKVSALVTNTGSTAGKQVLQLYYAAPTAADDAVLCAPAKQLCGFEKTTLLEPGSSERLHFVLDIDDMASYDDVGVLGEKSCFVMEKGNYKILIGAHSRELTVAGVHIQNENRIIRRCHSIVTTLPERLNGHGGYDKLPIPQLGKESYHGVLAIGQTILAADKCADKDITSLVELKKGESASYRLLPGSSGRYKVWFRNGENAVDISEFLTVALGQTHIKDLKLKDDCSIEMVLPLSRCEMVLTAKIDNPAIDSIVFEKIEAKTEIRPDKVNIIDAGSLYEGSFYLEIYNYEDDGFGNSVSCLGNFKLPGMYAVYKLNVKEAGVYDISFKYANSDETRPIGNTMVLAVSNIVQPLGEVILEKTYEKGSTRVFKDTEPGQIILPKGDVYLKLTMQNLPAPDIGSFTITKSNAEYSVTETETKITCRKPKSGNGPARLEDFSHVKRFGIQFLDVYKNPSLMREFLSQLSNRELATIVSGTSLNNTPSGDVGCNHPLPERGVPAGQTSDGPCGLRQYGYCPTAYPASMVLAASFNKKLYEQYGISMANECKHYAVDYLLGPAMNILRSPADGRNYSYFSEDPYLSGIVAAYYIKGVEENGIIAVLKHYAANNTEFERLKSNSRVSERALREIYIKGFELAVKLSNPGGIMTSYNHVNDIKICEDYTMITEIPRDEWEWDGVFFTDWWNDSNHVAELKAGHDLKMATGEIDAVTQALDDGVLTRQQVSTCAERVLKMLMKIERITKQ